jgi:hypothetical protein
MSIEAMRLALEALESGTNHGVAIDALRRALEQQPATATYTCGVCGVSMQMEKHEQQPADEPVAWMDATETTLSWEQFLDGMKPLYTRPQPAAWVGLTDDAIYAAAEAAWRAGWVACRDAEFVGEEAEDEAWGYQGATVEQDVKAVLREKNAA